MVESAYAAKFSELLRTPRLQPLGPGTPNEAVRDQLQRLRIDTAFAPAVVKDRAMAACCLSALWLYHDFLDESHKLSQDIDTTTGSYWHGIMHRREPDYGNSKYWFRRVGEHPVFGPLHRKVAQIAGAADLARSSAWDPFAFVDRCEAAARGENDTVCRQVQDLEWRLLFDYCYRHAVGK